jgi:hypothetical protein
LGDQGCAWACSRVSVAGGGAARRGRFGGAAKADRTKLGDQFIQSIVTAIAVTPSYRACGTLIVVTFEWNFGLPLPGGAARVTAARIY